MRRILCLDLELTHQIVVGLGVFALEIFHQAAAFADFLDETSAGGEIFLMAFQVFGEILDLFGENGDLDLRRTGVGCMGLELFNDALLFVLRKHRVSASFGLNSSLRMEFRPEGPDSRSSQ